jgi:hypothetical protein
VDAVLIDPPADVPKLAGDVSPFAVAAAVEHKVDFCAGSHGNAILENAHVVVGARWPVYATERTRRSKVSAAQGLIMEP